MLSQLVISGCNFWTYQFTWWPPAVPLAFLAFRVWWEFPFNPLKAKLLAEDLRTAQFSRESEVGPVH